MPTSLKTVLHILPLALLMVAVSGHAQGSSILPDAPQPVPPSDANTVRNLPVHILQDELAVVTSPAHLRAHDLVWLAPLAAGTGVALATDHHTMHDVISTDPVRTQNIINVSNGLTGGILVTPVILYGVGLVKHDDHAREAGFLASEAGVDGLIVAEGLKLITFRERPYDDNARGLFYQKSAGANSSFPSTHSVVTWAAASALASEYPSKWAQIGLYAAATGVSLTRVLGQQHFPSDVLVGSAAGWLLGHYVVHHRRHVER